MSEPDAHEIAQRAIRHAAECAKIATTDFESMFLRPAPIRWDEIVGIAMWILGVIGAITLLALSFHTTPPLLWGFAAGMFIAQAWIGLT